MTDTEKRQEPEDNKEIITDTEAAGSAEPSEQATPQNAGPEGPGRKEKTVKFLKSKRGSKLIVLLLLLLLVITNTRFYHVLEDWRLDHVTKIAVDQDMDALDIKWNSIRSKTYRVDVSKDGKQILSQEIGKRSYRLEGIEYLKDYDITVYGKNQDGEYVEGATETFHTRNPQKIEAAVKKAEGFTGDSLALAAVSITDPNATAKAEDESAETESAEPKEDTDSNAQNTDSGTDSTASDAVLAYKVGNEEVAEVSEDGKVTFKKEGVTTIKVTAPGDDDTMPGELEITAVCYPKNLAAPEISIKKPDLEDTSAVIHLKKVKYAENYEILRAAPGSEDYDTYRTVSADDFGSKKTLDLEIAKEVGSYAVRATADVGDTTLESDMSPAAAIEPALDKTQTYSSLTTVLELGNDDVDRVVRARGAGSVYVAQSMCSTGDGYVVAFVNRGNSAGCLRKYDLEGNEVASNTSAGHLGHANGCTYDPKTGSIYVMKTYAGSNYHDIRAFDSETLASKDSISFGTAPSGIGYDAPMKQFYMTASTRVYVTDEDLHMIRTIHRKRTYRSQDVAGYNGIVMSCIWTGGSGSYIDMYRALTGEYLGSICAPFGEIESACVEDGHLIMLFNGGSVYRTKERIDFPG